MTEENPRNDAGSIPPPPSRPPTSALPVITAEPARATNRPAAPAAKPAGVTFDRIVAALSWRTRRVARRIRRQGPRRLGVAAAVLVALGLLLWWAVASFAGSGQLSSDGPAPAPTASAESAPASRGSLPLEGVNPLDFQLRDCFKDFDPDAQQSTVVDCATGHSAQLVAVEKYGADDSYPGREALKQKARGICKAAPLTDKAGSYDLSYKLAYPSSNSWGKGDRRVDCYAVTDGGNVIKESLLP
ncbi:septum formation family protein [Arthrobacter sp. NPDC058130]|uniref:septum formation family protein n=1 Tax=Arthrobacter sp. NPDC058130 TaxID=3346353 RepID=UPI0036E9204D